ncbi:MAG: NAD(+) synthase [Muribaculaceae bacterium]
MTASYGLLRIASGVPMVNVADCDANVQHIVECVEKACKANVQLLVLPELCVTGYTCGDLFGQTVLLRGALTGIEKIAKSTEGKNIAVVVGAPVAFAGRLYNCAVMISGGKVVGIVPKTYIPNYREFYEKRWFASAATLKPNASIDLCGTKVPFGCDILFCIGDAKIACEICEDLWAPLPPSTRAAVNGANVIVNLSATNELVGKHDRLMDLIRHQSASCVSAYAYSSCGYGESTTDLVFAGNAIVAEMGEVLGIGSRFCTDEQLVVADVDIEKINNARMVNSSFADSRQALPGDYREVILDVNSACETSQLLRSVERNPFVPSDDDKLNRRCEEIFNIQTEGLMRRLQHTHVKCLVIGVSGGLDSTLALLIAERAFHRLGYDKSNIIGITMPGFGTSDRTLTNALSLMRAMGISIKEIPIRDAVLQHFKDIDHSSDVHDATYENSQARERTQILMDCANKYNGIVLGTGDLSELALGWATYNGDHMSMYGVNAGIAKTLVRYLVKWIAENVAVKAWGDESRITLLDIVDTPISPELTPTDAQGNIKQKTEDLVGPYELHDFFIYNMLVYGYSPRKIYFLARHAFAGEYDDATIKKWLTVFCRRFFNQQFKRSCLPDGPKVGAISLSPRGDWRMPSDACSELWLKECENLD